MNPAPARAVTGAAMAIVSPSEARAPLRFMLAHGDIVGTDHAGRAVLQLAVNPWTLDQLCAFDAGSEDIEGPPATGRRHL
jgi:hypothetical protein